MLSYKYHEWSTGTFDTIKISSYFLLKMNKFSLVTGLNCPEEMGLAWQLLLIQNMVLRNRLLLMAFYIPLPPSYPYQSPLCLPGAHELPEANSSAPVSILLVVQNEPYELSNCGSNVVRPCKNALLSIRGCSELQIHV